MTPSELLKKLEAVVAEAARTHLYGTIEIVMHDGCATVLRTLKTERLDKGKNPSQYENQR